MDLTTIYQDLDCYLREPRLRKLYRKARAAYTAQDAIGHNWEHVRRDIINAVYIGQGEKADMNIVMPATILHDIGYAYVPEDSSNHAVNGARECISYLREWDPGETGLIAACILKHKGKSPGFEQGEPETLEEKVVCDADQIDKFGWVGFMQMLLAFIEYGVYGKEQYKTLKGLAEGLKRQPNIILFTDTAREMAAALSEPDFNHVSDSLLEELKNYLAWKEPGEQG